MTTIEAQIDFVKSQAEFQRRLALKFSTEQKRAAQHLVSADKFDAVLTTLSEINERLSKNPNLFSIVESVPRLSLSWEEIEGLPPELLEELSVSESDKTEFEIRSVIAELGGIVSLDRLLVALYRKTGTVTKRAQLNQRLYRMVQKEMIYSVIGKKGVYSSHLLSDDEANKLI